MRLAVTAGAPCPPALHAEITALVGVPLVGTGDGGLADRRGEVIDKLLDKHRAQGSSLDCDVALILYERQDFAAVQARRRPEDWRPGAHLWGWACR